MNNLFSILSAFANVIPAVRYLSSSKKDSRRAGMKTKRMGFLATSGLKILRLVNLYNVKISLNIINLNPAY